jgi:hypothetical protein
MADYITRCLNSEIVTVELKWEPSGYWTALIKIRRFVDVCQIYFEAINAINLPPGIPSTFVGSSMTCNIPLSEFPPENLSASWCTGELYNYIKELSY